MKTIPPVCPEPETGPKYWRSLDHLAETPEFRQWVDREFPAGASEFTDPTSRRSFVKLMTASFLLAGLAGTGCRRPVEKILPFSKMPEGYIHGVSQYYATALPTQTGAIPLVVRSHEGRPVKIEGNPQHPDSNGATDILAQASILNLYDPDRAIRYTKDGNSIQPEVVADYLRQVSNDYTKNQGQGLSFLINRKNSPSRDRLQNLIAQKMPQARWYAYEPVDYSIHQKAATQAFGQSVRPYYKLDNAAVILSLDCDFVNGEDDTARLQRGFAKNRKITSSKGSLNRLYVVESLMTLTGANADHRLRKNPTAIAQVAAQFATAIIDKGQVQDKWIAECAKDLLQNNGKAVVLAGHRQPLEVHLLAYAMNQALGALGNSLLLVPAPEQKEGNIADLAKELQAGSVSTLVILGGNPAYNAPADINWSDAQKKAKQVIRLGYYEDESFAGATWHLPAAHYLESWGDARTTDGTYLPIQPLIEPLFRGVTDIEVLARIAGSNEVSPHDVVRATFREISKTEGSFDNSWKQLLHDGFLAKSQAQPVSGQLNVAAISEARAAASKAPTATGGGKLEIVLHSSYNIGDGSFNNNGWMQEMPDPITKISWDNAILVSIKTAAELGLQRSAIPEDGKYFNPTAEVTVGGRKIRGAVWIVPGMADNTLGLAYGYGRTVTGRVGKGTGFNAYALKTSAAPHIATGASLTPDGQRYELVTPQEHGMMEGRPIIREGNLEQYRQKPDFAKNMDLEAHAPNAGPIYKHPYNSNPLMKSDVHAWGMVIDLNSCTGCNACAIACQSENNVPIVGKEQVSKGREMHWLRIDRYFSSNPLQKDGAAEDPQVLHQPMLCQHCENAPCESVCPVNATVHDEEGLNLMAYNRCVGTRYCSNNCPYKVRRFNFFDYNRRPIDKLYSSPLVSKTEGSYELSRWFNNPEEGSKPRDEWELLKLVKNPDVTVRMRGVMEKCTFCVQRIESAKISQKVKARDSGNVRVPEGTFTTACAQVCPTGAIAFGNMLDPESQVSKLKALDRNYSVLGFLDTKPRLTYLARIRNPNPAMPDYHKMPLSLQEYSDHHGSPMDSHGSHVTHEGAVPGVHGANAEKKGAH